MRSTLNQSAFFFFFSPLSVITQSASRCCQQNSRAGHRDLPLPPFSDVATISQRRPRPFSPLLPLLPFSFPPPPLTAPSSPEATDGQRQPPGRNSRPLFFPPPPPPPPFLSFSGRSLMRDQCSPIPSRAFFPSPLFFLSLLFFPLFPRDWRGPYPIRKATSQESVHLLPFPSFFFFHRFNELGNGLLPPLLFLPSPLLSAPPCQAFLYGGVIK